jgi:hypothetical protein
MSTERWTVEVAPAGGPWHTDLNGAVFYTSREGALSWAAWLCGTWPAVRLHGDICEMLKPVPGAGGLPERAIGAPCTARDQSPLPSRAYQA